MNIKFYREHKDEIDSLLCGRKLQFLSISGRWCDFSKSFYENDGNIKLRLDQNGLYKYENMTINGVKKSYESQYDAVTGCSKALVFNGEYLYVAKRIKV